MARLILVQALSLAAVCSALQQQAALAAVSASRLGRSRLSVPPPTACADAAGLVMRTTSSASGRSRLAEIACVAEPEVLGAELKQQQQQQPSSPPPQRRRPT